MERDDTCWTTNSLDTKTILIGSSVNILYAVYLRCDQSPCKYSNSTGTFLKLFPLLARDSTLSLSTKLTLYKLLIRPVLTLLPFGAIRRLPTIVNFKFFTPNVFESLVITPEVPLSYTYTPLLTMNPFTSLFTVWLIIFSTVVQHTPHEFIYRLTDNFFYSCPAHPNLLVREIRNYTLPDLHRQYRKYIHKRTKHLLL